jgi:hypothetical protein
MMALYTWWLFVGAVFLLSGNACPNMLHIMTRSVDRLRRSTAAMAGCLSAVVIVLAASAAGLTTLLLALPGAFEVIRYGRRLSAVPGDRRGARTSRRSMSVIVIPPSLSHRAVFRGGFPDRDQQPQADPVRRRLPAPVHQSRQSPDAAIRDPGRHLRGDRGCGMRSMRSAGVRCRAIWAGRR